MIDDGIDIDAMGRKELQALAKNYGIKANQKSVVLRDLLREVIVVQKPSDEHDHDENEDVKQNKDIDDRKNVGIVAAEKSDQDNYQDGDTLNEEISKRDVGQENDELKFVDNDGPSRIESTAVEAKTKVYTEIESETKRTDVESDNSVEKRTKKQIATIDNKVLASKISFGAEKISIKKYRPSENKNEKFVTKLDQSYRSRQRTKQPTKPPQNISNQPTNQILKKETPAKQKEIPLWKIHAKDFIRTRGADVSHNLHSKGKKPSPTETLKRRPFGDRSNNKVKKNVTEKYDKFDVKKIPPKPQQMSKRNEDQMKLFLERQTAGTGGMNASKVDVKRIPPKPQAMSKRNEEQMKVFLERQTAGRKDRAKREQIRRYANCDRS